MPVGLYTTPNASLIGKGDVTLYAPVYDPADGGISSTSFDAYVTGASSEVIKSGTLSAGSGATAVLQIPESTLDADVTSALRRVAGHHGTGNVLVRVGQQRLQDRHLGRTGVHQRAPPGLAHRTSTWIPGTPRSAATRPDTPWATPATFYFAPAHGQAAPTSYSYQLNDGEPVAAAATSGDASASITPTSQTAILTVSARSTRGQRQYVVLHDHRQRGGYRSYL